MGRYAIVGFGCAGYNAAKELYNRVQNSIMKNAGKQKEE